MDKLHSRPVLAESGIAFGTSGARGLVEQFTPNVCAAFTLAFVNTLKNEFVFNTLAIAIDNRPSSYAMAQACSMALAQQGIATLYYGVIPTPALALTAATQNLPAIMVTGSHIPFDRNGLKFYRPDGEITKRDELSILDSDATFNALNTLDDLVADNAAANEYCQRYLSLFEQPILADKHIGIYEHSSAGRDIYKGLFEQLGAQVTSLERSDHFVPIDTEAVSEEDQSKAKTWSAQYNFDAIFSTDGDGDRPLVADENGQWLRGDILCLLAAKYLKIDALAVPVNCNSAIESSSLFSTVERTKIGSPYVIEAFESLSAKSQRVAGFEANGGFLLGSTLNISNVELTALPTRDAVLPALAVLALAGTKPLSSLISGLPNSFTASDRLQNFARNKSLSILEKAKSDPESFLKEVGLSNVSLDRIDETDGLRMILATGVVVHLRPSGNAPELRCYAESDSQLEAEALVKKVLDFLIVL